MENIWRWHTETGMSGIVVAHTREEAMQRVADYMQRQFDEYATEGLTVWHALDDDDFCNEVLAVAY